MNLPDNIMNLWSCGTCRYCFGTHVKGPYWGDYTIWLCDDLDPQDPYPRASYPKDPFEQWCEPCYRPKLRYVLVHFLYRVWVWLKGHLEYAQYHKQLIIKGIIRG